jgi:heme/copper-type cytochrome/quinol oxidase subunit 1
MALMAVFLAGAGSIISSANFLLTYRYLSTLGNKKMRDARSFFTEAAMISSGMIIGANPLLLIAILMLLSDRH